MKTQYLIDAVLNQIAARDITAPEEKENRAIDRYALDIIATYKTMARDADINAETREQLERALLIGCKDWEEYAVSGYALYHPMAIAIRINAPASIHTEIEYLQNAFARIADAVAISATKAA